MKAWRCEAENYTRKFVVRGIPDILVRVARARQEWVESKKFMFRSLGNADSHHHLIKFPWEMLPAASGPVEARGLDIFVLTERGGRIKSRYQFA